MAKCELKMWFYRPDRTYAGGEKVTGRVEVHADSDVVCKALTVTREWRIYGHGNKTSGGAATVTLFQGRWRPGEPAVYEFAFDAPNGPLTYHGDYFNVDWYLKARAEIAPAIDARAERDFILVPGKGEVDLGPSYKPPGPDSSTTHPGSDALIGLFCVAGGLLGALFFIAFLSNAFGWFLGIVLGGFFASLGTWWIYVGVRNALTLGAVDVEFDSRIRRRGDALSVRVRFLPRRAAVLTEATAELMGQERWHGSEDTLTHLLHEQTVVLGQARQLHPEELVEITGALRIPPDAPYTFAAFPNYIEWHVEISLALPGWTHWHNKYAIAVVPKESDIQPIAEHLLAGPERAMEDLTPLEERLLRYLDTRRDAAPDGLTETQLMQAWPDLRLRQLRSTLVRLEAAGRVRLSPTGTGDYRVAPSRGEAGPPATGAR